MAQLVEHILGKDEVTGSNPVSSSTQPQGIISNTPQKFAGWPRFYPTENTFGGDPEIYPTRKIKDFSRGDPEAPLRENYPPFTHFPLAG